METSLFQWRPARRNRFRPNQRFRGDGGTGHWSFATVRSKPFLMDGKFSRVGRHHTQGDAVVCVIRSQIGNENGEEGEKNGDEWCARHAEGAWPDRW